MIEDNKEYVRYYLIINENFVDRFGGQYFTFASKKDHQWSLGSHPGVTRIVSFSDRVIICDQDKAWYVKNRHESHQTAKVDPDELVWIKLSSTELML